MPLHPEEAAELQPQGGQHVTTIMPSHRRSAVAGATAFLACAVSSVSAYTTVPHLRATQHASRLCTTAHKAGRRVATGPSMIYIPPRIDENNVEVFNETTSEVVVVLVGEP